MKNKYKSPIKKLVKYFETSRDKWKARSHAYKVKIRKLEIKLHDTQASREDWRERYKEINKELELAKFQLEGLKKKSLQ
ncbi:MAG: hypothetical protein KAI79_18725 [Bacteroidales bacterium]|nr:hypothetical protein [Bacteroidales bacterium]